MTTIDKLFCNTVLEQKYPLAYVTTKSRVGSDLVPLIITFGIEEEKTTLFGFEKWWLEQPNFKGYLAV